MSIDLKSNPFFLDDEDIKWVEETREKMSTDEKIGQLFFPIGYTTNQDYLRYGLLGVKPGGVLFRPGPKQEMYDTHKFLQENSEVPLLLAANLEDGGTGICTDGTFYGKQMMLAASGDEKEAGKLGEVCAVEGLSVGCNYSFAPVADIDMEFHNPITNVRTYGSDADVVLSCALEYMKAAQSRGMATSVKHFPGDGVDETDQHLQISVNSLSCQEWDSTFGRVFKGLIDKGALSVMIGHIALPSYQKKFNPGSADKLVPASISKEILQDLLREQMGFNGMVITDSTAMVGFCAGMERSKAVPLSIEYGCDMFLFNKVLQEDFVYMKQGLESGLLSERRLNEAVTRILAMKAALKLHIKQKENTLLPSPDSLEKVGCETHKNWAVKAADKGVTLVKDTQNLLPLDSEKHKRVLVQILGDCQSNERVLDSFSSRLTAEGFEVHLYEKENFVFDASFKLEGVEEFRSKYDLVLYIGNIENASNKTTNRINWHTSYGLGNNLPWFAEEVDTLFISVANPYHLLDTSMVKTYINCYSNSDAVIDAALSKVLGQSEFKGTSPVDPFCGKEYLRY